MIPPRVNNLPNLAVVRYVAQERGGPVKGPAGRVLGEHVRVDEAVAGGGEAAEGETVVAGAADGEEDVRGLAESGDVAGCLALFAELGAEAVTVPGGFVVGEAEHGVPTREDGVSYYV